MKLKYTNWQNDIFEEITQDDDRRLITRGKAISIIVREGLFPLISKHGYCLTKNIAQFEDILASMLFKYTMNKNNIFHISFDNLTDDMDVHYDYYCNQINSDIWDRFWKHWDCTFENLFFYEESFGVLIQNILWECIDLKKSPTYLQYLEESYEVDENNIKSNEDPYILDNMNKYESKI